MKLTVIGRYGPFPPAGGACSCYLVEENGTRIILDMGSGTLARLQSVCSVTDADAIFISHLHYDHTSDLLPYRYLLEIPDKKVKILTQKDDGEWYRLLFNHPDFEVVNYDADSRIQIGSLTLSFREMDHTSRDYAVRLEGDRTLVYTGDTRFTPALQSFSNGADLLLADCAKSVGHDGPHMTVADAKRIHTETGVKILATHLSPSYDPTEEFADFPGISVAEEMKVYTI